jgi:hypothetical protein
MVVETTCSLIELGDVASAVALAHELCMSLKKGKVELDAVLKEQLSTLSDRFPASECKAFDTFAGDMIKYSPELRELVVQKYILKSRFGKAHIHAMRLTDLSYLGNVISMWAFAKSTVEEERDLIIVRAVLEMLAMGNVAGTDALFQSWAAMWRAKKGDPTPVLNCAAFALRVVKDKPANGQEVVFELGARYGPSLDRDPMLGSLLLAVGNKHFGENAGGGAGGGGGGMMQMLSGLLGGGGGQGGANVAASPVSQKMILDAD